MRGEGGGGARIEISSVRGVIIRGISSALEKCVCACACACVHSQVCGQSRVCGALHNYPLPHKHSFHSAKFPP